jgi:hypothetical protein
VQVLQQQDERRLRGQGVEGLDQLAQHPLARRPLRAPLHGLELGVVEEGGELRQPRGRALLQDAEERVAPRLPAHPAEGLEDREIRLGRAVLLDALPAADA